MTAETVENTAGVVALPAPAKQEPPSEPRLRVAPITPDLIPADRLIRNRISALPLTRYCGLAARLGAEHGAGVAALKSQAWHAILAGKAKEAKRYMDALDTDEKREVLSWAKPSDVTLSDGTILKFEDAEKEHRVGLDRDGAYIDPTDERRLTDGTLDFGWVVETGGRRLAVVGDLKKSAFTTPDGPESIQVKAYAFAYASKNDCDAFMVGLFIAETGEWQWSPEVIDLCSARASELWEEIRAAAENTTGEPVTGTHCNNCWERLRCPEYVLPATVVGTELEPLIAGELDTDKALRLLRFIEVLAGDNGLLAKAKDSLKAYVRQGGKVIDPASGKEWSPRYQRGRESVSVATVRDRFGEAAESVINRGKEIEVFAWHKP